MENPGARARKATWNQPLRGGLWILGAPTASGTALRPKCNFTLDLPGLLPPVWTSMVPKGRRPRAGPNQTTYWAKIRQGPNPICFIVYEKTKIWEGPERGGDKGLLCRRCTRQSLLQQAACTLANLTRGEVSSLLLHEPPQLGAAPPTHLIGWGSMHFDCYGPNKCGCVTISMPNPFRDRGPTCALGHRGRAPTE